MSLCVVRQPVLLLRARIRKRLRNLGIDSLESTIGSLNVYEFGLWARYFESLELLRGNAYLQICIHISTIT
jgi:hypothetical protein